MTVDNKANSSIRFQLSPPYPGSNGNYYAFYEAIFNDKKFSYPATNGLKGHLFFGSKKITLENEDKLMKITEIDFIGTTVYYCDPQTNHKKFNFLLSYKPRELTLEEARSKLNNLDSNFQAETAAYNRHGVVVFGRDSNGYAIFWASPDDESVRRIGCLECKKYNDNIVAKSYLSGPNVVNFKKLNGTFFLNREKAIEMTTKI